MILGRELLGTIYWRRSPICIFFIIYKVIYLFWSRACTRGQMISVTSICCVYSLYPLKLCLPWQNHPTNVLLLELWYLHHYHQTQTALNYKAFSSNSKMKSLSQLSYRGSNILLHYWRVCCNFWSKDNFFFLSVFGKSKHIISYPLDSLWYWKVLFFGFCFCCCCFFFLIFC